MYTGYCINGPMQGKLIKSDTDEVPFETTSKIWNMGEEATVFIETGKYHWLPSYSVFQYTLVSKVIRHDKENKNG